jgi:hypothetical protein
MWKTPAINFALRAIALLCLIFGFMAQAIANGQVFTHALFGIGYGIAAIICGLVSVQSNYANKTRRWWGWIMTGLGLMLALSCAVQLPSAQRRQTRFNDMVRKIDEMRQAKPTPNNALEQTATAPPVSTNK